MPVKVGAWNLYEGLGLPQHATRLTEAILEQDCDVMFLSDAYTLEEPFRTRSGTGEVEVAEEALERLHEAGGYRVIQTEYGEGRQFDSRYFVGLSRTELAGHEVVQLGRRNALALRPAGASLSLLGVHLSDETENDRIVEIMSALDYLRGEPQSAIIGDCNAMHGEDARSRFFGSQTAGTAAKLFPHRKLSSIGRRVHQMAWGTTFRLMEARGFRDVDDAHQPTFPSRLPVLHLDRCFVSEDTSAHSFKVASHNSGSDHRAIEAVIET